MNITIEGKVVFSSDIDTLEDVVDFVEQYGEVFLDDNSETLTLTLEEEWEQNWQDRAIDLINEFNDNITVDKITLLYSVCDHDSGRVKQFECQWKKEYMRYRDTDWDYDGVVDDDISYDEFEEEGHIDMTEEDFEEYVHKKGNNNRIYCDWEYLD